MYANLFTIGFQYKFSPATESAFEETISQGISNTFKYFPSRAKVMKLVRDVKSLEREAKSSIAFRLGTGIERVSKIFGAISLNSPWSLSMTLYTNSQFLDSVSSHFVSVFFRMIASRML